MPLWAKALILFILVGGWSYGFFWLGGEHTRRVAAEDKMDAVLEFAQSNDTWHKKLDEKLNNLPKSETKIHETVRLYPAPCPMPEPVADELQSARDKANTARKVPSDS